MTLFEGFYLIHLVKTNLFVPRNMTGTVLNPTFKGIDLTLAFIFLTSKFRDQNCPVGIARLKEIEPSNIYDTFWYFYVIHIPPISLILEISSGQFWSYILR